MHERVHSPLFSRWDCATCQSTHFTPNQDSDCVHFEYSSSSAKYSTEGYLRGAIFRWAHRQLLRLDWRRRRVIEIGCFNGFMVRALRDRGADAYGFDVNSDAIKIGRGLFELPKEVLHDDWEKIKDAAPFDDIICIDLIEHLEDPRSFIESLLSLQAPNSRLLLAGPTSDRPFRDKSDFPPHHRWWFTREGLRRMMKELGYQEEKLWVEHNAVLLFRNMIGRLLHGYGNIEFHGHSTVSGEILDTGLFRVFYRGAEEIGSFIFGLFNIQYCSAMFMFRNKGNVNKGIHK